MEPTPGHAPVEEEREEVGEMIEVEVRVHDGREGSRIDAHPAQPVEATGAGVDEHPRLVVTPHEVARRPPIGVHLERAGAQDHPLHALIMPDTAVGPPPCAPACRPRGPAGVAGDPLC